LDCSNVGLRYPPIVVGVLKLVSKVVDRSLVDRIDQRVVGAWSGDFYPIISRPIVVRTKAFYQEVTQGSWRWQMRQRLNHICHPIVFISGLTRKPVDHAPHWEDAKLCAPLQQTDVL